MDRILVCMKQVPNTREVRIDPEKHTLIREEIESIINPFDDFALEEALALKARHGVRVAAMTMGPPQAREILEYAVRRGADEAFLFTDRRLAGSDTWATALAIAALIRKVGYSTVFCGQESIDSGTGHIGASIAEMLNVPQVNYVRRVAGLHGDRLHVVAKFDGVDATVDVALPAVISFLKKDTPVSAPAPGPVDPGKVTTLSMGDLGLNPRHVGLEGSFTQVVKIDIDERFAGYVTVDSVLSADNRILYMTTGGVTEKKDRKVLRGLDRTAVDQIAGLIL
jgi:electron transfer flavoprotein beta subunit